VLGSRRYVNSWKWAAFGKHPALKDYFSSGTSEHLAQGFSDWVKSGFQMASSRKNTPSPICSWRFWVKGAQKETLACGLVRDSSDSLGRSYPILFLGTGVLENWEEYWDLLPLACETSWVQMEYLSTRNLSGLKHLEEELQRIRPPIAAWTEMIGRRGSLKDAWGMAESQGSTSNWDDWERRVASRIQDPNFFLSLDEESFSDSPAAVIFWHFHLKKKLKVIPNAIFIGGTLEKIFLGVFTQPLLPADFDEMWTVSSIKD
jgi:type VI secretion system protein VasJ